MDSPRPPEDAKTDAGGPGGTALQASERTPLLEESTGCEGGHGVLGVQVSGYYREYPSRFIVLLLFSAMALQQVQLWITYGTVAEETMKYYNVSALQIDLLQGVTQSSRGFL